MMMRLLLCGLVAILAVPASATNLYQPGNWSALASDRRAEKIGDSLSVLVYENASATSNAGTTRKRDTRFGGKASVSGIFSEQGDVQFGGGYSGSGQTARGNRMVAQLSVTVDRVLPNGDLEVSGAQRLNVNGERANIRLKGRVRPEDILSGNTVISTRLAGAVIEFDGKGFATQAARPGLVTRVFGWLGLL
jgi:flagellar L-ring protein FlgH